MEGQVIDFQPVIDAVCAAIYDASFFVVAALCGAAAALGILWGLKKDV